MLEINEKKKSFIMKNEKKIMVQEFGNLLLHNLYCEIIVCIATVG